MSHLNVLGAFIRARMNAKQGDALEEAAAHVVVHYPGFLQALFENCKLIWGEDVPRAGIRMISRRRYEIQLNPIFFSSLSLQGAVFVICHEAMHRMLKHLPLCRWMEKNGVPISQAAYDALDADSKKHCTMYGGAYCLPYDHTLMNIAEDYVINFALIQGKIGEFPVIDPNTDIHPARCPIRMTLEVTETDVYAALFQRAEKIEVPMESIEIDGNGEGDEDGEGGEEGEENGDSDTLEQIQRAKAIALQQAADLQKSTRAGKGAGMLARAAKLVEESQVNWREQLAQDIISRNARGADESWERIHRRYLSMNLTWPGRVGRQTDTVVFLHDTSGSVSRKESGMYYAETAGALAQCNPERVIVVPVDDEVHEPIFLENDGHLDFHSALHKVHEELADKYTGGGGTSFDPGFKWIEDNLRGHGVRISQVVYLTDGYGRCTIPEPTYPVTWVTTGADGFPFGKIIKLQGDIL